MEEAKDMKTNILLDTIRKELNLIINESSSAAKSSSSASSNSKLNVKSGKEEVVQIQMESLSEKQQKDKDLTDIAKNANFLDRQASQSIDVDLYKMQCDLQQSYELFHSIGEKFETINFGSLKNRIKHLNLADKNLHLGETTAEFNNMFEENYRNNQLHKLTTKMGEQFRKHPGEFGDIPELSDFFKACSQLQHGLEQLKKQRTEVTDLGKRMSWAEGVSYDRIDEIRTAMGKDIQRKSSK